MPAREMGTQAEEGNTMSRVDIDVRESEDMSEILAQFWFRLPLTKNLREEGINRFRQWKSDMYITQAMSDLVEASINDEVTERVEEKKQQKPSFFGDQRFMVSETDLVGEDYWNNMTRSWTDERNELKDDIKNKVKRRALALKPKITKSGIIPKQNSLTLKLQQVRSAHSAICESALQKTITTDRKKKILAEISDMDLWSRPMHHLSNPLIDKKQKDPLEGSDSLETMYSNVRRKVSNETLNNLLNPEPDLEDYIKTHNDIAAATSINEEFKETTKSNLSSRLRMNDDRSSVTSGNEEASVFADYDMKPGDNSGFGLDCLRDLVKFQDEGWNLQDDQSDDNDQPPSSLDISVHPI